MALPYELLIGLRYTRAKKRNHFISFISLISMLGIGLGVAALIVVLSVMNGFQKELRTRILGVASHIQITGINGELPNWTLVAEQAMKHPEVKASAPFVQSQGMFTVDGVVKGRLFAASCRNRRIVSPIFARPFRAAVWTICGQVNSGSCSEQIWHVRYVFLPATR